MLDLHVVAVGDFGEEVANRLSSRYDTHLSSSEEALDTSRWPRARMQVVATWRETPALFERADQLAVITRRPWLPITLDALSLRVGPLILGWRGPCYRCFLARQYQHRRLVDNDRRLFGAYDADPIVGVAGYVDAHVTLAALAAGMSIDSVLDARVDDERGRLRRFGLLAPRLSTDVIVPVHGCERCGHAGPDATWVQLSRDMQLLGLLSDPDPGPVRGDKPGVRL